MAFVVTDDQFWNKVRMVPLVFGMLSLFASIGGLLAFEIWALFFRDGARVGLELIEVVLLGLHIAGGFLLRRARTDLPVRRHSAAVRWSSRLYVIGLVFAAWYS